jgi:NTE family protein
MQPAAHTHEPTGLILTGGGARAAYQVGVLDAIARMLTDAGWPPERIPFDVVCGTSAGAINAAVLAAGSDRFDTAMSSLVGVWSGFRASHVYRTDPAGALGNAAHWLGALAMGWLVRTRPRSLFDNAPLADLIAATIDFDRLGRMLSQGHLAALAITASSYTSGQHVTWYQSHRPVPPWSRTQRLSCPVRLEASHLLASSAIPFVFPAVPLALDGRREYFGDGSMRQSAPISPAIHLGAGRILVVGAGQLKQGTVHADHTGSQYLYPSLAQVAGHALASIFLDGLANDVERLHRVNRTLSLLPPPARAASGLRTVEVLVIAPSRRLDQLAAAHVRELPRTVRAMLRMLGATDRRGAGVASYLLFERGYTQRLMALGRADALARRDEVLRFFGEPQLAPQLAAAVGVAGSATAARDAGGPFSRSARGTA